MIVKSLCFEEQNLNFEIDCWNLPEVIATD